MVISASLSLGVSSVPDSKADAIGAICVEAPILVMCCNILRAVYARYWREDPRSASLAAEAAGGGDLKTTPLVDGVV